ncbi:heme-binding protein [Pseudomonas veronii]|nr:heme-binding protein [Pseudomonas veronii]
MTALFSGGKPFFHDCQVIGAIGVSGASEAIDGHCAYAAVERVRLFLGR